MNPDINLISLELLEFDPFQLEVIFNLHTEEDFNQPSALLALNTIREDLKFKLGHDFAFESVKEAIDLQLGITYNELETYLSDQFVEHHRIDESKINRVVEKILELENLNQQFLGLLAAGPNNNPTANQLLKQGAYVNAVDSDGNTPLLLAAKTNNLAMIDLLLEQGAKINKQGYFLYTPLMAAIINHHVEAGLKLINSKLNPNLTDKRGRVALILAIERRQTAIVEKLLQIGANPNCTNNPPIRITEVVREKNQKTETIEIKAPSCTALTQAAKQGTADIVEMLVKHRANVNLVDGFSSTPLLEAIYGGHVGTVKYLLLHNAIVNETRPGIRQPLIAAAQKGHKEIVEMLLKQGANINVTSNCGQTPLMVATCANQPEVVRLLLKYKANTSLTDAWGNTAYDYSLKYSHKDKESVVIDYHNLDHSRAKSITLHGVSQIIANPANIYFASSTEEFHNIISAWIAHAEIMNKNQKKLSGK